ncbi:LTA synthase family protein [Bifidobacterium sp. SO4]|nr:LTA synthase family protein [Bifidobacterium sp. SO4]
MRLPSEEATAPTRESWIKGKTHRFHERLADLWEPVANTAIGQWVIQICKVISALWQKRLRFSYAFYFIVFAITNASAVTFLQWSMYYEPTYADPDAVDQTTKLLNSVKGQLTKFVSQMWMEQKFNWLLNFLVMGLIYLVLVFLINRFWIATAVFSAVMITFTVANRIKSGLRGEPILPSDLNFITGGNGGEISSFIPKDSMPFVQHAIQLLIAIAVACVVLQILDRRNCFIPFHWKHPFRNAKTIIGNCSRVLALLLSVVTLVSFTWNLSVPGSWSYMWAARLGDSPQLWNAMGDAANNGPMMNFLRLAHVKTMTKPDDYSQQTMEDLVAKYTKNAKSTNQTRAANLTDSTVIMILSESFSDPTRVPGVSFSEDPMPNLRNLKQTTTAGLMLSTGYGGGTANIEYQSLTGLSMAMFDDSMQSMYQELVPHEKQAYTFNQIWNEQYGENGSIAFHPYYKGMYLRDSNYKKFGFSKFLTLDSDPEITHQDRIDNSVYVSDAAAYQNVLDALADGTNHSRFMQLVTIQNHMPYSNWYNDNQFVEGDTSTLSGDERQSVETYAKGVNITDQATTDFLNQLDTIDKPITVIFYGDHLPGIYNTAVNGTSMTDTKGRANLYETDYFIWSNQASSSAGAKLSEQSSSYTSSNFFMSLAAEHMNAKVSAYLELLSELHQQIPAMSRPVATSDSKDDDNNTYLSDDGNVVPYDSLSAKAKKLLQDYELVQYDLTAGKGYLNDTDFFKVK